MRRQGATWEGIAAIIVCNSPPGGKPGLNHGSKVLSVSGVLRRELSPRVGYSLIAGYPTIKARRQVTLFLQTNLDVCADHSIEPGLNYFTGDERLARDGVVLAVRHLILLRG
jgi:hypothetical protein